MKQTAFEYKIKQALKSRERVVYSKLAFTESAVLVPLFFDSANFSDVSLNSLSIYFIRRSYSARNHAGNIAFPGGHVEKTDKDIIETAVREATEEISLQPQNIKVLGLLDDVLTLTSKFTITPVVALINQQEFTRQVEEVEDIFCIPADKLFMSNAKKAVIYEFEGSQFELTDYFYEDKRIWGATSRILDNLQNLLNKTLFFC